MASPEPYCSEHRKQARQGSKNYQAKSREVRGYGYDWIQFRKMILAREPYCRQCMREGRPEKATDVDHIIPHKGNASLRLNPENCQPLCKACHGKKSASESTQ